MATFFKPRRREFFEDYDGIPTAVKREDEVRSYVMDWTEELEGETISTAVWTAKGATIDSDSNTNTTTTVTISDSGEAEVAVVTSGGRTLEKRFRWQSQDGPPLDYRL
jgi:hypothetical protein